MVKHPRIIGAWGAVVLAWIVAGGTASATTISYDNHAVWSSGVSGSTLIGFEGISGSPNSFTVGGATFSMNAGNFNFVQEPSLFGMAVTGGYAGPQTMTVHFASPTTAVGFYYASDLPKNLVLALGNGAGFTITSGIPAQFFGAISDEPFSWLTLANTDGFLFSSRLDNFEYASAVPEPGSLVLVGIGLAALGRARRRRR